MFVLGLSLLPAVAGAATPPIGQVSRITGSQLGNAEAPGAPARKLAAGDPIFAGERIRTGAATVLQIEFTDKSRFVLGPNAEFEVGALQLCVWRRRGRRISFQDHQGRVSLRHRAHRALGKKNMKVSVSVATIGIRGTHVEGEVTERQEKEGQTVDASAKVVLLEPEGSDTGSAIVVENKFGSVVIDKPGFGTEIPDEKSPPSPVKRMQLRTIDNLLRTIRTPARTGGPARKP